MGIIIDLKSLFRYYYYGDLNGGQSTTSLVTSLMFQLSLAVQLMEGNAIFILLLRLLVPETSLAWYQDYAGIICLFSFPR
jgi:hypothetical protein